MRIHCPECGGTLSVGQVKPGNYRPTCKHCKLTFRLKVTDDDPPRFHVGKLPAGGGTPTIAATSDASVEARNSTSPPSLSEQSPSPASESLPQAAERSANVTLHPEDVPERLGGYKILRLLGRGAMGSVFEAKQVSLDRLVALKTIRGRLTENPGSLARFAREAYAAAQLTHHNIVQIYDFGEDAGRYFFSMEWVRGGPLDQLIREKGSLDPRLAAGYTLQAARGLQFAHRHGMVHRDIKPANLLLSEDGVIKVADLGLVKIPDAAEPDLEARKSAVSEMASGTQVTLHGTAVGTPAYMAPEQAVDAATVDHRADIYSLGCSLFCMLTGRPPFEGMDVSQVMLQYTEQPFPSAKAVAARVPDALERIIAKSTAKRPADRYASISEMIRDLEAFLGIRSGVSFSPSKSQADDWESIAGQYSRAAPAMRLVRPLVYAWTTCCLLTTVIVPMFAGVPWWLLGPSMWLVASMTNALLSAHFGSSAVVPKFRAWIGSMSWADWAIGLGGLLLGAGLLAILGLWPGILVGALVGVATATVVHVAWFVPASQARAASRHQAERFVRDLRLNGADETGLREFIARYSGPGWQTLFEELFGYDALLQIRHQLATDPIASKWIRSPTLRDKVCGWLTAKTRANVEARDRRQLARVEARSLAAEGLSADEARDRAWQIAAAIMEHVRSTTPAQPRGSQSAESEMIAVQAKRERMKAMLADARSGRYRKNRDKLSGLKFAFAGQTRLLAGCLLLAWFAWKGHQTGLFDAFGQLDLRQLDLDQLGSAVTETASTAASDLDASADSEGSARLWSRGVAGLLLCMSAFVSGWRMTPFAVVATLVLLFGPALGVPSLGPVPAWIVAIGVALLIYLPGIVFGETAEE